MVSPKELNDKRVNDYNLKVVEETIDSALLEDYKNTSYHKISINQNLPVSICQEIAEKYQRYGWSFVYYTHTTVDLEETTLFILSEKEEPDFENDNYKKVWKGFRN